MKQPTKSSKSAKSGLKQLGGVVVKAKGLTHVYRLPDTGVVFMKRGGNFEVVKDSRKFDVLMRRVEAQERQIARLTRHVDQLRSATSQSHSAPADEDDFLGLALVDGKTDNLDLPPLIRADSQDSAFVESLKTFAERHKRERRR